MLLRFVSDYVRYVLKGGPKFYAWMGALSVLIAGMLYVYWLPTWCSWSGWRPGR